MARFEDVAAYPHPGEVLWCPGGVSETELLIAAAHWRRWLMVIRRLP